MIIHVVEPGDSLYKIGQEYGVSPYRLAIDNGIEYNSTLVIGQTIVVQFPTVVHTVKQGESLYTIAKQYGVSVISLYQNNPQLNGRSTIMPGEQLVITYDQEKLGSFEVNGYGEPSISDDLLRKTLPYLTYVTPFTYGLTQSGSLVMLNDNHMIDIAKEYDTAPLMHLSTLTEKGNFDSARASIVLNNQMIQDKLIDEIIENMNDKGYYGLDVDFEFINKQDAEKYAAEDKKKREEVDAKNEAENLCFSAEKVIKDAGDKIDEADKNDINQKIATLRETISGGNVDAIKLGTEDLQKAVYAVSEKLYKNQAGQANPADNTTPPAGDANGADGQVYDADFKDVDSDKKDGENK